MDIKASIEDTRKGFEDSFATGTFYNRQTQDTAYGYEEVLAKADKAVKDSYELVETDTEIFVTEGVNNIMFEK